MQKTMQAIEKYMRFSILPVLGLLLSAPQALVAQEDPGYAAQPTVVLEDQAQAELLGSEELAELVGPIALYPDDLVAIVLPAATYPLQIAQAADFLERLKDDPSLEPDENWDDSVVALLNYPEVVAMMNEDLTWTWQLGNAVLNQQADVVQAIGGFRDRAYAAGNLKSDDHQNVVVEEDVIEITPVDPEVIYVPYYEPAQVVVVQRLPVYHYYPYAYPVYYYPYPYGYSFSAGYFWGVTTAFTIGWHSHYIHQHHYYYPSHPYYSHHYYPRHYTRYYPPARHPVRPAPYRANYDARDRYSGGDRWQSRNHQGSRPVRWSDSGRVGRTMDGNVSRAHSDRNRSTAQISSEYRNALAQDSSLRQVRSTEARGTRGSGWKERDLAASSGRNPGGQVNSDTHNDRLWRRPGKENGSATRSEGQGTAPATRLSDSAANTRGRNSSVGATRNDGDSVGLQRQLRQELEQDTRQRQASNRERGSRSPSAQSGSDSRTSGLANANTSRSARIGNQVRQELQQDARQRNAPVERANTSGRTDASRQRSQAANPGGSREVYRGQASDNSRRSSRTQSAAPAVRSQPVPKASPPPASRSQPEVRSESRPAPKQESRRESSAGKSRPSSGRQKARDKPR